MSDRKPERNSTDNTYPQMISSHVYKYGEGVYVWFDEAGLAIGASCLQSEAERQLDEYSKTL